MPPPSSDLWSRRILPELAGKTVRDLEGGYMGVVATCTGCRRAIAFTPAGMVKRFSRDLDRPLDELVDRFKCAHCGKRAAQLSGRPMEPGELTKDSFELRSSSTFKR